MAAGALAFLLGITAATWLVGLPPPGVPLALLAVAALLAGWRPLRWPAWGLAGFAWAGLHAQITAPSLLPATALAEPVTAEGVVEGLPRRQGGTARFFFLVDRLDTPQGILHGRWRLRVAWYRQAPPLAPGERWRLVLRIRAVTGFRNPGGFDYAGWLYHRGVRYRASVRHGERIDPGAGGIDRLRLAIAQGIERVAPTPRSAAVLRALTVGDRNGLDADLRKLFQETGTSHLMAISGLHVGLVAGLAWWLGMRLWRLYPRGCAVRPDRVVAAWPAMLAALGYSALAGFSLPTQRALLMLLVAFTALVARRHLPLFHALGLALVLVLLFDPLAVTDAGFWLSFGAVALILAVQSPGRRRPLVRAQLAVSLGLLPLLVWQGLGVSLVAPLVNLVAIPLFSLVVVPAAGLALGWEALRGWPGDPPVQALGWLIERLLDLLAAVARWNPAVSGREPWLWAIAGALAVLLVPWLVPPGRRCLAAGLVAAVLAVGWLQRPQPPPPNQFDLTVLDVGQGLSVVVRTARHLLVYDTGPAFASGYDAGRAVLVPYLRSQGLGRVDLLVLSHGDRDHTGGTAALREAVTVARVLAGEPQRVGPGAVPCRAGDTWWWDGVRFEILSPLSGEAEGNDASCVLRIASGRGVALLSGDAEAPVEEGLASRWGRALAATLVVAGHHGSATSSTPAWVAATRPRLVLFSAGLHNPWHFPRADVVSRWCAVGARPLNTAWSGAIEIRLGPEGLAAPVHETAERAPWWWQRPPERWPRACSIIASSKQGGSHPDVRTDQGRRPADVADPVLFGAGHGHHPGTAVGLSPQTGGARSSAGADLEPVQKRRTGPPSDPGHS